MNLAERKERIESFGVGEMQEENWDSYGAAPVDKRAIEIALKISEGLGDEEWFPSPEPNGNIIFEKEEEKRGIFIFIKICGEAREEE